MMVRGDDRVDLHGGDVVAAGGQRARHVPSAARADDQGLGARPDRVGQGRPLRQSRPCRWLASRCVEIVIGNRGGGVGIDDDGVPVLLRQVHSAMREKLFHLMKNLVAIARGPWRSGLDDVVAHGCT